MRSSGEYFIDSANTETYSGYDVVDIKISHELKIQKGVKFKIYLDANNVFDEHYSKSVWNGYGTNNYALASPRTVLGGFQINW